MLWSRQASERLSKATEYIAQATREINSEASRSSSSTERRNDLIPAGIGPVGLYYFFSPADQGATKDVAVLNKIWREGRIGVVGIPVRENDEEIIRFVNEARPLFPVRKSDAEVKLVKPVETPDLYLALPLEKKILRLGSTITETAIAEAIGSIVTARTATAPCRSAPEPSSKGRYRGSAGDCQDPHLSEPTHPRPAERAVAAIRSLPDNLRSPNRLRKRADRGTRSDCEPGARKGTFRAPRAAASPKPAEAKPRNLSNKKVLTTRLVRRYSSGQKKKVG